MKKISIILMSALLVISISCVDDYTDANPPRKKNAPTIRLSTAPNDHHVLLSHAVNAYQSEPEVLMQYGEPVDFTVSVIKAPGQVGDISVTSSIPEYGTVTVDDASVSALNTQTEGSFMFTFTPSADFADATDRSFNIVVTVSDQQVDKDGEAAPKTTTMTIPVTLVSCFSSSIEPGFYIVTELTANEDGGAPIALEDLEGGLGEKVVVEISMERPGLYTIDEVTGGVWPVYYSTRARPTLQVDLCGSAISGREGASSTGVGTAAQRNFTINGTANEDGTVHVEWSYVREDGATPASPATGAYTLTPISAL